MNSLSNELKTEFAAIFGYSESDQIESISIYADSGEYVVTIAHRYCTDKPITYKERSQHPAKVIGIEYSQFLVRGTESDWVIEHSISRFVTKEELAKTLAFQAKVDLIESNQVSH